MPKKNPTKEYYDTHAKRWSEQKNNSFYHEGQFSIFARYFKKGDRILDIGCAGGIHVPLFLGIGRELKYEGLDVSNSFLKIARQRYPQLTFTKGDVLDAKSFPAKKCDGFWAAAVLMHIPEEYWPQMLATIQSRMKPAAVGYITVPQKRLVQPENDERHFTVFTPESFNKRMSEAGWKILKKGTLASTASHEWLWFIVKLPK